MVSFDPDIEKFCRKEGLIWTRFSDDIVITRRDKGKILPASMAPEGELSKEALLAEITEICNKHNFWVNKKKTLHMHQGKKVRVCGFVVNEILNLDRKWVKKTFSMLRNTLMNGVTAETAKFNKVSQTNIGTEKFLQGKLLRLELGLIGFYHCWLFCLSLL